ncbi:response regulator transcription factor [Limnoglobus roseus]|uniref:response regulator transcription factor n=1 Tax=Limnoglobus roseus TaxID=2598579 RepID=UPI00143D8962|nr:helix-turn-helix transcriptional regulator [Limnoglobus roseus]
MLHEEIAALFDTRLHLSDDPIWQGLTPRLRDVLMALRSGDSEKQIALRLGLSRHTVHEYVGALYRRFGVSSRPELMKVCQLTIVPATPSKPTST